MEEDDVSNYIEGGEPPPDELTRKSDGQNVILGPQTSSYTYKQRYKCYSCEPPDCSNPSWCGDAIQVMNFKVQCVGNVSCMLLLF